MSSSTHTRDRAGRPPRSAPTAAAGAGTAAVCDTAAASTDAAPAAPDPAQRFAWRLQGLSETAWWHTRSLQNLARRHGSSTVQQRRRLFDSVVRHVNAGDFDLDEANAFLHTFGIARAAGPGAVSFHLPVARAMIHEDVESDIGTFQYRLEETQRALRYTRPDGYPDGFHVARPSRADIDTGRRHTVVSTTLRLTVAVTAYTDEQHLVAVATARLREDLTRLREEFDVLDEPRVCDSSPPRPNAHADTEPSHDSADDGADDDWAYQTDDLDEDDYIDYGLDIDPDETADEFDHATRSHPRDPFANDDDGEHDEYDENDRDDGDDGDDDWQYDR